MLNGRQRLYGLEDVTQVPTLMLALESDLRSAAVIHALALRFEKTESGPECRIFPDRERAIGHIVANNVHPLNIVVLFDHWVRHGKCMSPLCRRGKGQEHFPQWAPAFWAEMLGPRVDDVGILRATNQIHADFHLNYLSRIDAGQLPWGSAPELGGSSYSPRKNRSKTARQNSRWAGPEFRTSFAIL